MVKTVKTTSNGKISRAELEEKIRNLVGGGISPIATGKKGAPAFLAGAGALIILIWVAYLLGKKRGFRRSTIIEIRRD